MDVMSVCLGQQREGLAGPGGPTLGFDDLLLLTAARWRHPVTNAIQAVRQVFRIQIFDELELVWPVRQAEDAEENKRQTIPHICSFLTKYSYIVFEMSSFDTLLKHCHNPTSPFPRVSLLALNQSALHCACSGSCTCYIGLKVLLLS